METRHINIADIDCNEGQVLNLPINPRQWTRTELDILKASIQQTPELLEARGVIVYPYDGRYIVMGGNMRLTACRELNMATVPCIVLDEDTPIEKLKEIVIKDNGSFGSWDFDLLGNEWDDLPLTGWGVPAWNTTGIDSDAVDALFEDSPINEKDPHLTVTVPKELEDKMPDIISALEVTLEEWAGCTVK